ncbi:MAG: hypothetical protein M0Z65_15110 [Firmicutes bacterium]|uniref:DUF5668 domain-containing protein n=1 Tax=Melghirimyces thermohalophilus TaxID=1236220 RepID=A0A1G6JQP2_9BACL|nr:hypothetical protein [Melghirimyces thermohalophilus]MDA8354478.1 hypothetical protein [Bacillota bacterium]TMZ40995.1 hypothetical protein EMG21_33045 [Klebsiella pneumoniae]SDC21070.1 hypothetical protein SAMN04488112_104144 [Melghirimyces thermohalophilus]
MRAKTFGILIALTGVLLLLRELGYSLTQNLATWEFLLILTGVFIILHAMRKPNHPYMMIWGGIAVGLGLHAWGLNHLEWWPSHWSLVPAIIGAAFLICGGIIKKNRRHGTIGTLLLCMGIFAWPGIHQIPGIGPFAVWLNTYWPGLLIILGLMLVFRKK